ncbi:MAG: 16S rRNA (guanine(527)-N(7))-methyltransferase RsmG [Stagnimonas sp.]|nr:16S rRNA (guanine(527)-N(7))-methyltransferase RsmG [Stagnimonas sp.]
MARSTPPDLSPALTAGLKALRLPLEYAPRLLAFQTELEKWNFTYNLTAIRDPREMVTRHLLDSLAVLPLLRREAGSGYGGQGMGAVSPSPIPHPPSPLLKILDVGAGAGLPCIPLAIVAPELHLSGIDSVGKKVRFMRHAQRTLGLTNFEPLEGRVEDLPATLQFDTITSRAFASLADFFRLTRHLLAADGQWVAMKGKLDAQEQADIPADVEIVEVRALRVPGLNEARHAVIARVKK